jgi:DNA primase
LSIIEDIKVRVDIVDLVSEYVALEKSGANFSSKCPFHNERTPSFFVFPSRQTWRCFGACATGGDIFSFIMKHQNFDFPQVLTFLASKVGIEMPSRKNKQNNEELFKINEESVLFYSKVLMSDRGESSRRYLLNRGISTDTMSDFCLGLSPSDGISLKTHLKSLGFKEDQMILAGMLTQTKDGTLKDFFRDRIMVPILDQDSRAVGFGGRVLGDFVKPKYMNTRRGLAFDKSKILFGFHLAKDHIKENGAVIVEGYMDAIVAHQAGFRNVVASMGTALTAHQVSLLNRITTDVILALDPDEAGQEATLRSLESSWRILQRRTVSQLPTSTTYQRVTAPNIRVASLPSGKDPDKIIVENPSSWANILSKSVPVLEFLFTALSSKLDLTTSHGKAEIAAPLLRLVSSIPEPFEQDRQFRRVSELLEVSEDTLKASMEGYKRPAERRVHSHRKEMVIETTLDRLERDPLEEYCLVLLVQNPKLDEVASNLRIDHFERIENREAYGIWVNNSNETAVNGETNDHFAYLMGKILPIMSMKEKELTLVDSLQRLEERRLRRIKKEEALSLDSMTYDQIIEHESDILKVNAEIETLFRARSNN